PAVASTCRDLAPARPSDDTRRAGVIQALRVLCYRATSAEAEVHWDRGADLHRAAALAAGLELGVLHRLQRRLAEPTAGGAHADRVDDVALLIDDELDEYG